MPASTLRKWQHLEQRYVERIQQNNCRIFNIIQHMEGWQQLKKTSFSPNFWGLKYDDYDYHAREEKVIGKTSPNDLT
ncbi:MAG: hypothetical protein M1827_004726 [Pycnora praestabilis]|nr:MAG: hypothetical protein M1827_004726 [Pycnora praestabilis]